MVDAGFFISIGRIDGDGSGIVVGQPEHAGCPTFNAAESHYLAGCVSVRQIHTCQVVYS